MVFSNQAFELLQGLRDHISADRDRNDKQTLAFYQANKDALRKYVAEPFQDLAGAVAARLPNSITQQMVTNHKSNFGKIWLGGGAVAYYWGAFYPKRSARKQEDAQLLTFLSHDYLEFGFFFGWDCTEEQAAQFENSCTQLCNSDRHYIQLLQFLKERLPEKDLVHRDTEYRIGDDGSVVRNADAIFTWDDLLHMYIPDKTIGPSPMVVLPTKRVLEMPKEKLAERIAQAFTCLYPLVLLAAHQNPSQEIGHYLAQVRRS
jgi:hypothetical protein